MFLIEFQIKYVTIYCPVLTLFPVDCRISAYKNKGNTRFFCWFTISKTSSRSTVVRLLLVINYHTAMRSFSALFTLFFFLMFNAPWSQGQSTTEFSARSSEATTVHTGDSTDIRTVTSGTDHPTGNTGTRFSGTAQPPGTTEPVTALPPVTGGTTGATEASTSGFTNGVTTTTTTKKATSKGSTMDTLSKTNIFQWFFVISMSLFLFMWLQILFWTFYFPLKTWCPNQDQQCESSSS